MPNDSLTKIINIPELDSFHTYGDPFSNVRYYHHLKARQTLKFIISQADKEKIFLDAGAGLGPYSAIASPLFKHVYMYEYDEQELKCAVENTKKFQNITSEKVDLRKIPLEDSSVDSIICCEVLEHVPNEELALLELRRVLKHGGRLLISMPNAFSLFYWKVRNLKNHQEILQDMKSKNLHVTDPSSLEQVPYAKWEMIRHISFPFWKIERMATNAGFTITKRTGVNIIPLPYFMRKFLMSKFPLGLKLCIALDALFGTIIPFIGSFYFIEIQKT